MKAPYRISLYVHDVDADQKILLDRVLKVFHEAQETLRIDDRGPRDLNVQHDSIDFKKLQRVSSNDDELEITVTRLPMTDNWFSHATTNQALITLSNLDVAFLDDENSAPRDAPDATLLMSFAFAAFALLSRAADSDVLHDRIRGCISDYCQFKPDRAIKMRAAHICSECVETSARRGVSPTELDSIRRILEAIRRLTFGRPALVHSAPSAQGEDDDFLANSPDWSVPMPSGLLEACRASKLVLMIGSGLSLQDDVDVAYPAEISWKTLPKWSEIPTRLSACLFKYRQRNETPRQSDTIAEFLADMDYFRQALGEHAYYPRTVFDIFAAGVQNPGRANRILFRLHIPFILTTNYDFVLNAAAPSGTLCFTWREARQAREFLRRGNPKHPVLLKLHGCASRTDTVVLTRAEYDALRMAEEYQALRNDIFATQAILFIGYGMNDPLDLDLAIQHADLAGAAQGEKYVLVHETQRRSIQERFSSTIVLGYQDHSDIATFLASLWRASRLGHR